MQTDQPVEMSAERFRAAMRCLANGVSLITCRRADGAPQGMLATAVTSVTADPPTLLICINRTATMHEDLVMGRAFCVNFLGAQHVGLTRRFASAAARETRFDPADWADLQTGSPALRSALASLDCRVESVSQAGSHSVLMGRVVAEQVNSPPAQPLVYFDGRYGGWAGA